MSLTVKMDENDEEEDAKDAKKIIIADSTKIIHTLEAGYLRNFWMLVWGIRTDLFYWESALGFANLHFATFMKICGDSLKYRKWPSKTWTS